MCIRDRKDAVGRGPSGSESLFSGVVRRENMQDNRQKVIQVPEPSCVNFFRILPKSGIELIFIVAGISHRFATCSWWQRQCWRQTVLFHERFPKLIFICTPWKVQTGESEILLWLMIQWSLVIIYTWFYWMHSVCRWLNFWRVDVQRKVATSLETHLWS